jgi:hypothetical protein
MGTQIHPFFHKQAQQRKWKNTITKIQSEDSHVLEKYDQVKEVEVHHFVELCSQSQEEESRLAEQDQLENISHSIASQENSSLTKYITKSEIFQALLGL